MPAKKEKEPKKAARAIATRTCLICGTQKSCVNKTGVCGYCFEKVLTSDERRIAQEESEYKVIKVEVVDKRWDT